jgi:hypothetical protein
MLIAMATRATRLWDDPRVKDLQLAIQNYEASLRLNPDNHIAKERLKALTGRQPQR